MVIGAPSRARADDQDGLGADLSAREAQRAAPAAQGLSVSAAPPDHRSTEPGVVCGCDLHSDAARLPLPRRHYGPGRAARFSLGGSPTRWMLTSVLRRWRRRLLATAGPASSTPTRATISPTSASQTH